MNWKVINASVRGSSHQRSGLPNQDAVDYGIAPKGDKPYTVLAVADGHGGGRHFRSQVGSTLAVHVAVKVMGGYLASSTSEDGSLSQLGQEIVNAWDSAVQSDLAHNPFTGAELDALEAVEGLASRESVIERPQFAYGATLLVAAVTESRMVFMQLGDGDILAVAADGTTSPPIEADDRLGGNETTSLCQPDAWREFRTAEIAASAGLPVLVLLSSDGYMNSFRSREDFVQIGKDYLQILLEQGSDTLADELPKILTEATQQGSGDDITLGMLHAQALRTMVTLKEPDPAATKQPVRQSVIIRELTEEQKKQQKKLDELESHYTGARKHVLQLRILLGVVALVVVAALARYYWQPLFHPSVHQKPAPVLDQRGPGKSGPTVSKGDPLNGPLAPPDGAQGDDKPPAGPGGTAGVADEQCVLVLTGGKELTLMQGMTISSPDIAPDEEQHPYAKVRQKNSILYLVNLSQDTWTVTSPADGKKFKYANNDQVPLHADMKITFNKSTTGSISFRSKSS
jgi:Protein phosphatase 2C